MSETEKRATLKPKAEETERGTISVFISKSIEETFQLSGKVYETLIKGSKEKQEEK